MVAKLIAWAVANPEAALALGYLVLEVLNLWLPKGKGWRGQGIVSKLRQLLDRATIGRAGSGTLPGQKTPTEHVVLEEVYDPAARSTVSGHSR